MNQKQWQPIPVILRHSPAFIPIFAEKFLGNLVRVKGCMSVIGSIINCVNPTFVCRLCCGKEDEEDAGARREGTVHELPAEVVARQRIKSDIIPISSVKESRIFIFDRDGTMLGYNQASRENVPMMANIPGNVFDALPDRLMQRLLRAVIEHCFNSGHSLQFRIQLNTPDHDKQYVSLLAVIQLSLAAPLNGIADRKVLKWSLFSISSKNFHFPLTYLIWPCQYGGCKVCAFCSSILVPPDTLSAMKTLALIQSQPPFFDDHTSGAIIGEFGMWHNDADPWISPRQWRDGFEALVPEEQRVVAYELCPTCEQDCVATMAGFNIRQPTISTLSKHN